MDNRLCELCLEPAEYWDANFCKACWSLKSSNDRWLPMITAPKGVNVLVRTASRVFVAVRYQGKFEKENGSVLFPQPNAWRPLPEV